MCLATPAEKKGETLKTAATLISFQKITRIITINPTNPIIPVSHPLFLLLL